MCLRHGKWLPHAGEELVPHGWMEIRELLNLPFFRGHNVDENELEWNLRNNCDDRFEIAGNMVRARSGHTIANLDEWHSEVPRNKLPAVLWHTTVEKNVDSILRNGLWLNSSASTSTSVTGLGRASAGPQFQHSDAVGGPMKPSAA